MLLDSTDAGGRFDYLCRHDEAESGDRERTVLFPKIDLRSSRPILGF